MLLTPTLIFALDKKLIICEVDERVMVEGTIPIWYFIFLSFRKNIMDDFNVDLSKVRILSICGFISFICIG